MRRRRFPARRGLWIGLGSVVLLLIAARIALPAILENYVNKRLCEIHGYYGHVDDIDVHLIRGAYVIKNVKLMKSNGKVKTPFVAADRVDLSVEWHALFDGSFVGEMAFEHGSLNFVKGPSKEESQNGVDHSWMPAVDKLFPLRINKVEITDGEVHYQDTNHTPPVDVYIDNAHVVATNLTNSRSISDTLYAVIEGKGRAMKHAPVEVHVETDPNAKQTTFDLNASLRDLKLVELNQLMKAYGGFDFEKGVFDVDTELAASKGHIHGYVKPIFKDVKILSVKEDAKNPVKMVWESIVATVAKIFFTNQSKDQMATVIPLKGPTGQPGTSMLSVIGGLFKNAFVQALKPGVEGTVNLDKLSSPKKEEVKKKAEQEVSGKKGDGDR